MRLFFWRRKPKSPIYYIQPRPWYRRPRRSTVRPNPRRSATWVKIRDFSRQLLSHSLYRVFLLFAVAFVLLLVVLSGMLSIQYVDVVRQDLTIDSARVENALRDYVGRSILFTQKSSLAKTIINRFPEFKSVDVKKILPDRIQIRLEAQPFVANLRAYYVPSLGTPQTSPYSFSTLNQTIQELAQGNPPSVSGTTVTPTPAPAPADHASDFATIPGSDSTVSVVPVPSSPSAASPIDTTPVEQRGILNALGQVIFDQQENLELMTITIRGLDHLILDREQVIPTAYMEYILSSLDYFQTTMSLDVGNVVYFPAGREIHLKVKKSGLSIWITLTRPFDDQIDKFKAIYETAELNKENLAYVDLRVKEKVIYCPRSSSCRKLDEDY